MGTAHCVMTCIPEAVAVDRSSCGSAAWSIIYTVKQAQVMQAAQRTAANLMVSVMHFVEYPCLFRACHSCCVCCQPAAPQQPCPPALQT